MLIQGAVGVMSTRMWLLAAQFAIVFNILIPVKTVATTRNAIPAHGI